MKKLILIPLIAVLSLATACGDDAEWVKKNQRISGQIQQCVAKGGNPLYTSDKYGDLILFLGCGG